MKLQCTIKSLKLKVFSIRRILRKIRVCLSKLSISFKFTSSANDWLPIKVLQIKDICERCDLTWLRTKFHIDPCRSEFFPAPKSFRKLVSITNLLGPPLPIDHIWCEWLLFWSHNVPRWKWYICNAMPYKMPFETTETNWRKIRCGMLYIK